MKDNQMGNKWHAFIKYTPHILTYSYSKLPTHPVKKGDGEGRGWDGCLSCLSYQKTG